MPCLRTLAHLAQLVCVYIHALAAKALSNLQYVKDRRVISQTRCKITAILMHGSTMKRGAKIGKIKKTQFFLLRVYC